MTRLASPARWLVYVADFIGAHRLALTHGLAVAAAGLMAASTIAFEPVLPGLHDQRLPLAAGLLLAGVLALGGAMRLADLPVLPAPDGAGLHPARLHRRGLLLAGAGVMCLWLLAEANGSLIGLGLRLTIHAQFGLWAGGIALVAAGLSGWGGGLPRLSAAHMREAGVVGAVMLLALGLRLYDLEQSARFLADELAFTDAILDLFEKPYAPLLEPVSDIGGFPHLFPYAQAHTVNLLGRSFTGLRVISTVIGTLHIAALYVLARALFDQPVALIAAVLLATFPPHMHFSRLGLTELPGAACGTAGLAFLARAALGGARRDYALAGVMIGLTHYFHEGGRLLYTPLAGGWLLALALLYRGRVSARGALLAGVALVIVAAPNYYALVGMGRSLATRLSTSNVALDNLYWDEISASGDLWRYVRGQIINPLLMYLHNLDGAMFYLGRRALVLPLVGPVFLLGAGWALWRWRRPGPLLLVLWVLAVTAGNSLLLVPTSVARYVIVFAAVALLMALGLRYGARLIVPDEAARRHRLYGLALGGLVAVLAFGQGHYYFSEHIPAYNQIGRALWGHRDGQDAVLRARDFPPGTHIHIISGASPAVDYVTGLLAFVDVDEQYTLDILTPDEVTADYLGGLDMGRDHAFFIEPGDVLTLYWLRRHFYLLPEQTSPYPYIAPEAQFALYFAPYVTGESGQRLRPENP